MIVLGLPRAFCNTLNRYFICTAGLALARHRGSVPHCQCQSTARRLECSLILPRQRHLPVPEGKYARLPKRRDHATCKAIISWSAQRPDTRASVRHLGMVERQQCIMCAKNRIRTSGVHPPDHDKPGLQKQRSMYYVMEGAIRSQQNGSRFHNITLARTTASYRTKVPDSSTRTRENNGTR